MREETEVSSELVWDLVLGIGLTEKERAGLKPGTYNCHSRYMRGLTTGPG